MNLRPAVTPAALGDVELDYLRQMLLERSGLALSREKRYLVESRLTPICRQRKLATLNALVAELRAAPPHGELERLVVEAMTTNETLFFRDRTPFDLMRSTVLPKLLEERASRKKIRIWCAAASTGQEPYSIAMILEEFAAKLAGWTVDLIATDISDEVIRRAKQGIYSQFEVQRGLPIQLLLKNFTQNGEQWQISPRLRGMVDFRTLNLMRDFSALGEFDLIFCRNVLIYFEPRLKTDVLNRLARSLSTPTGMLVLGASETVLGLDTVLMPHPTIRGLYARRPETSTAQAPTAPIAGRSPFAPSVAPTPGGAAGTTSGTASSSALPPLRRYGL